MSECCKSGFKWQGTPVGKESTIGKHKTYVSGSNPDVAVLMVHDIYGWTLNNLRLLADHFAAEANATVYLPDFFAGEVVSPDTMQDPVKREKFDLMAFIGRNSKDIRGPEIFAVAEELRSKYKKVGATGYCYGGWAVFQLGAKAKGLVDCVATAHPSLLTKEEINEIGVPVQILAPETDVMFTPELKAYANATIPTLGVPYTYEYFPGVSHGWSVRCDEKDEFQRNSMIRAKNATAAFFREFLHESK